MFWSCYDAKNHLKTSLLFHGSLYMQVLYAVFSHCIQLTAPLEIRPMSGLKASYMI